MDYRKVFVVAFLGGALGVIVAGVMVWHYLEFRIESAILGFAASRKQEAIIPQATAPQTMPSELNPTAPLASGTSRKEIAWKRFYKPPPGCEVINEQNMVTCGEERLMARKLFEEYVASGKLD